MRIRGQEVSTVCLIVADVIDPVTTNLIVHLTDHRNERPVLKSNQPHFSRGRTSPLELVTPEDGSQSKVPLDTFKCSDSERYISCVTHLRLCMWVFRDKVVQHVRPGFRLLARCSESS